MHVLGVQTGGFSLLSLQSPTTLFFFSCKPTFTLIVCERFIAQFIKMAEVIGIFAGIAQLTAQVTQGIIKLKGYWDGVKDAPREITSIIHDVELINCILCDLGKEYSHGRLPASAFNNDLLSHSLTACRVGAQELKDLVETLTFLSLHKTRFLKQRASLNVVLKQDQIKRYKSRLKRATSILSLAHQSYTRQVW